MIARFAPFKDHTIVYPGNVNDGQDPARLACR